MTWSKTPELTIKKGEPAKYQGVLVPELNYKNYKTFEAVAPEMEKLMGVEISDAQNSSLLTNILWGLAGVAVGAVAVSIAR